MKNLIVAYMLLVLCGCADYTPSTNPDLFVSPTVTTTPASNSECPTGGTDVTVTSAGHAPTVTSICNGAVGQIGATGSQGNQGVQGNTGATGPAGKNGSNASPTTFVQFCKSYGTTTYPSNFPEYGICSQNILYAVYWNGTQAFLAEIVPGIYQSTSPQGCNFTVYAGCQVVQN